MTPAVEFPDIGSRVVAARAGRERGIGFMGLEFQIEKMKKFRMVVMTAQCKLTECSH